MSGTFDTTFGDRYSRQTALPQIDAAGQEKLAKARVLIVGVGGLGSTAAMFLAGAGVGSIGLVDYQLVEISNLHRQPLYDENDVGKEKVICAEAKLRKLNSSVAFTSYAERFSPANAERILTNFDLIVDGTDNFSTKYFTNDICVLKNIPFIAASLYRFSGQISLFNAHLGNARGPTYRCLFPNDQIAEQDCSSAGVIGPLAGMFGTLQAMEAIKHICQIGKALSSEVLMVDVLNNQFSKFYLARRDDALALAQQGYEAREREERHEPTHSVSNVDFEEWFQQPERISLIDLRETTLVSELGGLKVPYSHLIKKIEHIKTELSPSLPVVVYCETGLKSTVAVKFLRAALPEMHVLHLETGLNGWRRYIHGQ